MSQPIFVEEHKVDHKFHLHLLLLFCYYFVVGFVRNEVKKKEATTPIEVSGQSQLCS